MNGYVCIWDGMREEVYANSQYEAQKLAEVIFQGKTRKRVHGYQIAVILAEKDGKAVTHDGAEL